MAKVKEVNKARVVSKAGKGNRPNPLSVKKVKKGNKRNKNNKFKKTIKIEKTRPRKKPATNLSSSTPSLLRSLSLAETLSPSGDNLASVNPEFFIKERKLRQLAAENRAFNSVVRKTGWTKEEIMCRDAIEKELEKQEQYEADLFAARKRHAALEKGCRTQDGIMPYEGATGRGRANLVVCVFLKRAS